MLFLKSTSGKPSASFTMMVVSFTVVTLWLFMSIVEHWGPVHIRPFSASEAMAYLTPCMALYFGRRQTESAAATPEPPPSKTEL